jgi:lipoate-protein ligase A
LKEKIQEKYAIRRRLAALEEDKLKVEEIEKRQARKRAFAEGNFEEIRIKPTRREWENSKKEWYKGIHYQFDIKKGFPVISRNVNIQKDHIMELSKAES